MFDKKFNLYFDFILKIIILLAIVLLFYKYNNSSSILLKTELLNKLILIIQILINNINEQILIAKNRLILINKENLKIKNLLLLITIPTDTLSYNLIILYIDLFINNKNDFLNGLGLVLFKDEN